MRYLVLTVSIVFLLGGCGYHVPKAGDPWAGQGGQTLYVKLFVNQTLEPYADSAVSDEISAQLSRSRLFELSENSAADLMLDGAVVAFSSQALAYDTADRISEYSASMTVRARLVRRSDGAVLWQDEFARSETYASAADKSLRQDAESLAARVVARRIAEDLVARLQTGF